MTQIASNGIMLEYERCGDASGPAMLLIHGVGAQLVRWPQKLCDSLASAGFDVIRFDNRDVGLSTHFDDAGVPDLAAVQAAIGRGDAPDLPYTLSDMAADATGLLDGLGITSAHVLGVSLGGMIAQMLAIEHPGKVLSMAIVMSQSGNPELPGSEPAALAALAKPAPNPRVDEAAYIEHSVALNRALGSPDYPAEEEELRELARRAAARSYNPAGNARQLAASRGGPDRRAALARIDVPTLVIHGADDPLVKLAGGEDIARSIGRSWLLTIQGMGHDLPDPLVDIITSAVCANVRRATDLGR